MRNYCVFVYAVKAMESVVDVVKGNTPVLYFVLFQLCGLIAFGKVYNYFNVTIKKKLSIVMNVLTVKSIQCMFTFVCEHYSV